MAEATAAFVRSLHADFDEISTSFAALKAEIPVIAAAADIMTRSLQAGKKIIFCGNGGSAADS